MTRQATVNVCCSTLNRAAASNLPRAEYPKGKGNHHFGIQSAQYERIIPQLRSKKWFDSASQTNVR